MKKIIKNGSFLSFFLCILLGSLIVIPNMIAGGGIYHLTADFDFQLIPFNQLMNDSIKNGSIFYTWFNDMGSNFIGTFSFYNVLSPFSIIGYLFPSSWFPYLIGPICILKYGFAGLFSFIYIKRYVKDYRYALIGSLLYSFSGFQLTNILFSQFQDVVAFFPLLLYSLDCFVYEHKKGLFSLCVFLVAITNWFFLIEEGIFVILYFLVKYFVKDYILSWKQFFMIIGEGILGSMMAMFILLPSLFFIQSNPRIGYNWTLIEALKYPITNYFELIRAFLFLPDVMANRSIFDVANYNSVELYLPVVGIIYVITYILKRPKDSFSIILYILLLFMFIPILNSIFVLFNTHYYARWFFIPILMMCVMTSCAMESKESIKIGSILSFVGIILFILLLFVYSRFRELYIGHMNYLLSVFILSTISIVITVILYYKTHGRSIILHTISIFVIVSFIGNYMIYQYKNGNLIDSSYHQYLQKYPDLVDYVHYRSNSIKCDPNISFTERIYNLNSFNTNISGSAFQFYNSLGLNRETSTIIHDKDIMSILGVDTIIYCGKNNLDDFTYVDTIGPFSVYENLDAFPLGYVPKNYMLQDDYDLLDISEKIQSLKQYVIFNQKQIKQYQDYFSEELDIQSSFHYRSDGFSMNVSANHASFLVIQVPYDKGWYAMNRGVKIPVENVDFGLVGIPINEGDNHILFHYHVPGLMIGICFSITGLILYGIYIFFVYIRKSTIFE